MVRNITAYDYGRSIGVGDGNNSGNQVPLHNTVGIKRFRTGGYQEGAALKAIGDSGQIPGYGICALVQGYTNQGFSLWSTGVQQADFAIFSNYLDFIEGPNEINNLGVGGGSYDPTTGNTNLVTFTSATGQDLYVKWMTAIFNFLKGSTAFASGNGITGKRTQIVAASLAGGQSNDGGNPWAIVGSAAQNFFDLDPIHNYPGSQPFTGAASVWDNMVNFGQILGPGKQSVASEIGHNTGTNDGADWISETAHAKIILNAWADLCTWGNPCMFIYTNQDNAGAVYGQALGDQPFYGILRSDGSTKVVARAIKNILTLTNDNNASFQPASYQVINVSGVVTPPGHLIAPYHICIAKSDGSFWYVLWNEPDIGGAQGADTVPPNNFITVDFNGQNCAWTIYDPMAPLTYWNGADINQASLNNVATAGQTAVASGTGTALPSNTLNLVGYPKLLKLVPALATVPPGPPTGVTIGTTTATSQGLSWIASTNQPASYTLQLQPLVSNGAWTTVATIDASNLSYTFLGLIPNTLYFYRMFATNSISNSTNTTAISATTKTAITQSTTPSVIVNNNATFRDDHTNVASRILSLPSVPNVNNSVFVFFNGFAGAGGNNNAITPPAGAILISGPNYDPTGGQEVTWCWQLTSNLTANSFTFTNFDSANNAAWKIVEVANVSSFDVNHGSVSSATATAVSWPLAAPKSSNSIILSQLSITFASTNGTPSSGLTTLVSDPLSVNFHQDLLFSAVFGTTNASIARTGGNATDADCYLNVNLYGASLPNQVTGLTQSNLSSSIVGLTWNSLGTSVTSYSVQISSNAGSTWTTFQVVSGSTSNATATGLNPNTAYQFRVFGNNDNGAGPVSTALLVTTPAVNSLQIIQSAIGIDNAAVSSVTTTLPNPPTVGNLLVFYFTCRNTNPTLVPPAGSTTLVGMGTDTNTDSGQMMWTLPVTGTTSSSFTYPGYNDIATLSVVEVQGVVSVNTPTHSGTLTFTDGPSGSVVLPVVAGSATPYLGIYGINMDLAPASYGTMPAGIKKLQAGLGNTTAFHQGLLLSVDSTVTAGSKSIPYVSSTGIVQGSPPMFAGVNLIGASQVVPPGSTSLVFGTATATTQPLTWPAASGTVTGYKIIISTSPNMT